MICDLILTWTRALPIRAKLLEYVRESGVRAWLVGGTVRDALLGRESMDLDLAVEGDALAIAQRAANRFAGASLYLREGHRDLPLEQFVLVSKFVGWIRDGPFARPLFWSLNDGNVLFFLLAG